MPGLDNITYNHLQPANLTNGAQAPKTSRSDLLQKREVSTKLSSDVQESSQKTNAVALSQVTSQGQSDSVEPQVTHQEQSNSVDDVMNFLDEEEASSSQASPEEVHQTQAEKVDGQAVDTESQPLSAQQKSEAIAQVAAPPLEQVADSFESPSQVSQLKDAHSFQSYASTEKVSPQLEESATSVPQDLLQGDVGSSGSLDQAKFKSTAQAIKNKQIKKPTTTSIKKEIRYLKKAIYNPQTKQVETKLAIDMTKEEREHAVPALNIFRVLYGPLMPPWKSIEVLSMSMAWRL